MWDLRSFRRDVTDLTISTKIYTFFSLGEDTKNTLKWEWERISLSLLPCYFGSLEAHDTLFSTWLQTSILLTFYSHLSIQGSNFLELQLPMEYSFANSSYLSIILSLLGSFGYDGSKSQFWTLFSCTCCLFKRSTTPRPNLEPNYHKVKVILSIWDFFGTTINDRNGRNLVNCMVGSGWGL